MESGEVTKTFNRKLDIMNILSHFIRQEGEQYGQGDKENGTFMSFTPSEYKTQLHMSTEDRLEALATMKSQFSYSNVFKVTPEIVIFQQFLPKKKYNTTITIINADTESHFVKIVPENDPVFLIEFKGLSLNTRVAPGMSHVYNIQFSPDEAKDYDYQLNVSTDLGSFSIPIIALGPRPILDFPDIITLSPTPVRIPSSTILTIQNLGDAPAIFKLSSPNPQFSIKPSNGVLNPHQALQFILKFTSSSVGNFTGLIFLKYETGEVIRIRTQGSTINCKITLSTKDLKMEDTFLGLSTDKTIKILNESDYTLEYQWMRFQSIQEDDKEKEKFSDIFTTLKDTETLRYTNLEYFDICNSEIHEKTCERILQDEISSLGTENFLFSSKNFILSPTKGKIWPRSSSQVLVTFQPQKMGEISITAFLEVSGSELRIPLSISGTCRGPEIKLNASTIEIEKIYLCSTQNIEIIASNLGFIPGTLMHKEKPSDFGGIIKVSPKFQELSPNDYKSFNLSFMPSRTGEFVERVDFIIDESLDIISIYIKGISICPSLHFNKPWIDLGPTGVGFTSTGEVVLQNRSTVPVKYRILILDDVEKPPTMINPFRSPNLSSNESALNLSSPDFLITPNQGILESQSSTELKIEFTPHVARGKRENNLRVEVEGSDGVQHLLPIFYQSELPVFEIEPTGVILGSCFINFPYTIAFSIKNESNVEGLCYFPRQSSSERTGIFYSLSRNQWHLKPKEAKKASITLITRSIGQQPMELCLRTHGGKNEKYFPIICEGQGPTITVEPSHLDFGDVKVLERTSKNLKIINDSPIPADFRIILKHRMSPWSVFPSAGEVLALKSVEIDVELMIRDPGSHSDKLIIEILNRPSIIVSLAAVGTGSSIIFDPVIFPEINFGVQSTHQDNSRVIMIKNEGTKVQKLSFSNNSEVKNVKSPPTSSTFFIEPFAFELDPGAAQEVKFFARSEAPGDVLEHWWIHSMAEGQRRREILGKTVFSATFLVPAIKIDKKVLNFFVNVGPDEESCSEKLINELRISNTSGLMLNVKISTSGKFRIIGEEDLKVQMMNIVIYDGDTELIRVCFIPEEEENNFLSRIYEGRVKLEYDGGSSGINVKCKASVNYPEVTLNPKQLEFDAIFGEDCERNLIMKNEGSVPVYFNLFWNENSVHKRLIEASRDLEVLEVDSMEDFGENNAGDADRTEVIEESINELFRVSESQGLILPNSEEIIVLNFSAKSPMTLEAQLICEVLRGRNELIKINARTDSVRYNFSPKIIDIGYQNIFSDVHEVVIFNNSCELNLNYRIYHKEDSEDAKGILQINPSEGIAMKRSKIEFKINYKCLIPGNFEEKFTLQIENSSASHMTLLGCAILPQIYLNLPHNWEEKNYPSDKEYSALQSLDYSNKIEEDVSIELIKDHHRLIDDNWDIIYPNEFVPTVLNIDMRIEQFLTTEFIKSNRSFLLSTLQAQKPGPIPYLYSADYILDMNYLITDQLIHQSLIIYNYSPRRISIRMKPPEKKNYLSKYGIMIKFRDQESLMPQEFSKIDISINPPRDIFLEKTQKIRRKIYLEVINGCTVPISIIGTVTSPFLKLSTTILNFGDVIIGNCRVMNLVIQNGGIVNCKWRIKMYSEARPIEFPFSLSEAGGIFTPGESGVISAYFKPRRGGNYEVKVIFEVDEGRSKSLMLMGRGIEQKLRISDGNIIFPPGIPGVTSEEREFSVKNLSKSPLEFSWQHLDEVGVMEERVMRVLTHYYGSKEILLPLRELGASLPKKIYDFYGELIEEMNSNFREDFKGERMDSADENEDNEREIQQREESDIIGGEERIESLQNDGKNKKKKNVGVEIRKKRKLVSHLEISKNESTDHKIESGLKNERTSDEIEDLLHNYVDKLQRELDFNKNMKDPVSDIFAEFNLTTQGHEDPRLEKEINIPKDRNCIIFNGAPFTKYQETACKVAKVLEIPLLNLNNAMTELIATGESPISSKIRKIIDEKYQELLIKAQKFIQDDYSTSRKDSPKKIPDFKETEDYLKGNVNYVFVDVPDPLDSFRKIPDAEELETLDPLSQYEYKIEAINLLEIIVDVSGEISGGKGKSRAKETEKVQKNIETSQREAFADTDLNSYAEILKEILMKKEFEDGFVLQTLQNDFIKNNSITFSKILDSIPPEFITFINFHNSLEIYKLKVTEKRIQIAKEENEKLLLKLKQMDEMSLSEFEELSEDDKNLFYERVQRPRIEEARLRREKFTGKILKPRIEEELPKTPELSSLPKDKPTKSSKKIKGKVTTKGKKSTPDAQNDKTEAKGNGSGRRNGRKESQVDKSSNDQTVAEAMDVYNKNLDTIISMIDDKCNIWLAAFTDPWDPTIYDFIIDKISQNKPKIKTKSIEMKISEPEIEEKIYSLYEFNKTKSNFSPLSDEIPFEIQNIDGINGKTIDSRTILGPNEAKYFRVVYNPKEIGEFHHEFILNIIGNNKQVCRINLSGISDIPHLNMDPKMIFTRISESKINEIHDPTFFLETKIFDFGFLLTPEKDKKDMKVHHKISHFTFINPSLINVNVDFSLMNGYPTAFSFDKSSVSIPPGEKVILKITSNAPKIGPNNDKLLLRIENNPQVEEISLKSSGCQLNVEIDGKMINFGRILLYRKDCRRVTIKNKTPVGVFWRIIDEKKKIDPQISFSSFSGVIQPMNEIHFDIYFHGQLVGILDKELIPLGIFLFENDEEFLIMENISISVEVYDVSVDINDANPIDFKTMKIGEKISKVFSLKNRGQYDINFVIELEKLKNLSGLDRKLFRNFKEHFKVNPLAGTLIRDKLTFINGEFTPKMEMKLKELPILKCNLFDTSKNAAFIAEIPLTISITAQYSKFIIEPHPELFSGSMPIYSHKTTSFSIKNTGIFPIDYKISSEPSKPPEATEMIEILPPKLQKNGVRKKGRRSIVEIASKSSKKSLKPSEEDNNPLKIGPFTLNKTRGTINTGEVTEISIDCYPELEGKLTNHIYIKCSDSYPEDQNGRELILNLDSCIPTINFNDLESIFCNSYIVDKITNFSCNFDDSYSIFSKEEMTLYFEKVIVSNVHRVGLKFYNPGLIPAELEMNLRSADSSINSDNVEINVFGIEPQREIIPAMSTRMFEVAFTPASMKTYSCILEAGVVLPDHLEPQKLSVKLNGEGCMPEITLIEPKTLCKHGNASLEFGKCLLGETGMKIIVFENTGKVRARIIVEICDDVNSFYHLRIDHVDDDGDHDDPTDNVEIIVNCGDISTISVVFTAKKIGIYEALVRVFVSDNPYEITNVNLRAEGFIEPVVIKGLALINGFQETKTMEEDKSIVLKEESGKYKKKKTSITKKRKKSSPVVETIVGYTPRAVTLVYELDIGICSLGEERILEFEILNTCEDKYFRFEFSRYDNFSFIPTVGHLNFLERKRIVVKFCAKESVMYEQLYLNCLIDEIQLFDISEEFVGSWDDQQMRVEEIVESNFEEGNYEGDDYVGVREINCPVEEPNYQLIHKDTEMIQLVISAVAAWTTYHCPVEEINFEDTFVLEKRNFIFKLTNPGVINLIYSWRIIDQIHDSINSFEEHLDSENSENFIYSKEDLANLSVKSQSQIVSNSFHIFPETGLIIPNQTTEFFLTFSPEEEKQYNAKLICKISNLDPQMSSLNILISGKAFLPHYHFDIPESTNNYSTKNIVNLPENIRIILFNVIGVGNHHTKQFNLINPTDELYEFTWREKKLETTENIQFPYFYCETAEGIAKIEDKTIISFTFFAKEVGTFESFWEFSIGKYGIKAPFLLVGVVAEPQVTCCPSRVELRPTVPGDIVEASVILTNNEEIPLRFSVMESSLFSESGLQRLSVKPETGILIAKNEESLKIKFKPTIVGNFDFSLEIEIEKMKEPLKIFFAARVCEIIPRIVYIDRNAGAIEIRPACENLINLGKLMIKKQTIVEFELSNMGELPIHYQWNVGVESSVISKNIYNITINEAEGDIRSQEAITSFLSLMALKRVDLRNHQLTLKIINGPIFTILLNTSAKRPSVEFSFIQHNFGGCYIRDSSQPYEVILKILNNEETPVIVEVNTENLVNFMINSDSLSAAISAPKTVSVPIYFQPVEEKKYEEFLTFTINSTIDKRITLKGEGIPYKVNLLKPQDKLIDLGHVPLGKTTKRSVSIINSGKTPVKLQVNFIKLPLEDPDNQEKLSIINAIKIYPTGLFLLHPDKPQELLIKFKPRRRMNSFEKVIGAHIGSTFLPFAILRGKCLAPEFHLNRSIIQFDAVTEGFTEQQKIILHNSGDFTSKFKWNLSKLPHNFTIKPVGGISFPGSDVTFDIRFTPTEKSRRIEGEGVIEMENYKKIIVNFIGTSQPLPEASEIINFMTPVRKEQQRQIELWNDLKIMEKIEISIFGNYFTSDKFMNISPKSSKFITIKYLPLIMTSEDHFHEGKIVLKLLEQKLVKIYELRGSSSYPESLGKIIRKIPAKKKHTELFLVENWDNKTQCFMTNIELILSSRGNEVFTFVGNDRIDVSAKGRRSYQAIFHCFNESTLNFKVTFTNSEGEYQFYDVEYKIIKPEILKIIELITTARTLKNYSLEIINPLEDKNVNYSSVKYNNSSDIIIEGLPKLLSPNSVNKIEIKYLPMFPGESRELIEVMSDELEVFPYELKLKSLPPAPEKIVNVSTSLGSWKKFSIPVKNFSRNTAEFIIITEDPFVCKENKISIVAGEERCVELIYEPSSVGRIERNLVAASKTAGEIVYPIVGTANLPKAQGPFTLNSKKPLIVPFKNIFGEAKTFQYVVDPTISFSTSSASNVIDSKQNANVVVSFKASSTFEDDGEKVLNTIPGKLVIYCTDPELCHINWIYYLKGVVS